MVGILVFALTGKKYEILLFLSVFVFAMLSGIFKTCIKFLLLYGSLFLVAEISPLFITTTIHYFILCFITIAFAAFNLIKTTEISEILAALHNMKIPYYINIPLAVILRFFPTIKQRNRYFNIRYVKASVQDLRNVVNTNINENVICGDRISSIC